MVMKSMLNLLLRSKKLINGKANNQFFKLLSLNVSVFIWFINLIAKAICFLKVVNKTNY